MGVEIKHIRSYYEYSNGYAFKEYPLQVFSLAKKSLQPLIEAKLFNGISHLIVATTCPDMLAPSLGQMLCEEYFPVLSYCHCIDIVQGCASGVSALILASQLSELNKSEVLVVQADAARKATSGSNAFHKNFGNGSFACIVKFKDGNQRLIHSGSQQYEGLSEVVTVKLGHDADHTIISNPDDMKKDPRIHLGLTLNNGLAIKLLKNAEQFYIDFVQKSERPDVMILHQANKEIVKHLKDVFSKYPVEFIDVVEETGNCGAATVGIALSKVQDKTAGKKVMLCSYGTGGVITAGLWQN